MPDQRSVMKEYRSLDQKRVAEGLTPAEETRYAQLRDLIGPEMGAGGITPGFDVDAAAARLRDSLLPAGLRNRPPAAPAAPLAPEPAEEPSPADALASAYASEPFAPLEAPSLADTLFDPATLEGAEAPPPGDEAGAQGGWDPNAPYDPAAPPYDPNVAAEGFDPAAQPAWDPSQPFDPSAPYPGASYDPNAAAEGYDPGAQPAWDPNQPFDPNVPYPGAAHDPNAAALGYDPAAQPAWDPNQPFDPNAPYPGASYDPNAAAGGYDPNAPAWDPGAGAEPAAPYPESPAFEAFAAEVTSDQPPGGLEGAAGGWDPSALSEPGTEPPATDGAGPFDAEGLLGEPEVAPSPLHADAGALPPVGWDAEPPAAEPAAPGTALGEYDEMGSTTTPGEDSGLESMLPFDPAAAAALEPGVLPEGFAAPILGEYDDNAGFSGAFPEPSPADLPRDDSGFEAARSVASAATEGWHPAAALDDGFLLESGGSFEAVDAAAAPEWALAGAQPPWDSAGASALEAGEVGLEVLGGQTAAPDAGPVEAGEAALAEAAFGEAAFGEAAFAEAPVLEAELVEPHGPEAAFGGASGGPYLEPLPAEAAPETGALAPEPFGSAEPELPTEGFSIDVGDLTATVPSGGDLTVEETGPDLSGPAPALDFSRPDFSEGQLDEEGAPPAALSPAAGPSFEVSFEAPADLAGPEVGVAAPPGLDTAAIEEEIPTIDGEEILEEIPPDEAGVAPAPPIDFEPLVAPAAVIEASPAPAAAAPAPPPAAARPAPKVAIASPPPPPPATRPAPPPPAAARAPEPPPAAAPFPDQLIEGAHRVVVHTVEGQVKRGVLEDADLGASSLGLLPQPGGAPELFTTDKVKAIFFMLAPGEKAPSPAGKKVRVTFRDGRQVAGFSPDYRETGAGFFMIPGDTRTNTGRIWVYRAAVKQVVVT